MVRLLVIQGGGAIQVKTYRDLALWQKAMFLAKEIYPMTQRLPAAERFGLASQLRRAAVSVPSNIAEGQARGHSGEFRQFLYQALGSLAELDTQLPLACELGFLSAAETDRAFGLIEELRKMAHTFASRLPAHRPLNRAMSTGH